MRVSGWDEKQVRAYLADECERAGGQKYWAAKHGVSAAYVCDVLQGRRDPGRSILKALGLKVVIVYAPEAKQEKQTG